MKIIFTKLNTTSDTLSISFDSGKTFKEYKISDIKDNGVQLSDDQDLSAIYIKGKSSVLKNLDVIKSIGINNNIFKFNEESHTDHPVELYDAVEIAIPDNIESIGIAFDDYDEPYSISESFLKNFSSIKKIIIPESVKYIAGCTFASLPSLEEIEIKGSPTIIGEISFNDCYNLKYLPESFCKNYGFNDGVGNLQNFGSFNPRAFSNCNCIKDFYFNNASITISSDSFNYGIDSITIDNSNAPYYCTVAIIDPISKVTTIKSNNTVYIHDLGRLFNPGYTYERTLNLNAPLYIGANVLDNIISNLKEEIENYTKLGNELYSIIINYYSSNDKLKKMADEFPDYIHVNFNYEF